MFVTRFDEREVSIKKMIREVHIKVAALRFPSRKLFTDALDKVLPNVLTRDLKNVAGEL